MAVRGAVQRIQDSVHGLMEFRGLEASLIEVLRASELQRLRRIRQLGLVHLVFPAAEHSRLVHSLGAAHVSLRFARRLENATREFLTSPLQPDEESRRDLALAALCHDLGHGPLSHVWEKEVVHGFDAGQWAEQLGLPDREWGKIKWHELIGQAILRSSDTEIHQLLAVQEEGLPERIAALLLGDYHLQYLPSLLSGDVDVDRCDYVLRDAYQAGVAYGRFDLNWLISTATVGAVEGKLVVGFDRRKAPRVIEQFLVARRALYDTVYQHRTARAAEGMVGLLLRRIRHFLKADDWILKDTRRFESYRRALTGNPVAVTDILQLDDYSLWVFIMDIAEEGRDPIAADLAKRIVGRHLFKQVPVESELVSDYVGNFGREPLESIVADACGVEEGAYYLVYDQWPFDTFSKRDEEAAYLVAESGASPGEASFARDHRELRLLDSSRHAQPALYAPAEAIEPLSDAVSGAG
jgi:HD superfamily phosphohydrolase